MRLLDSLTRELVCYGIVLAVDMPNCPGTTSKSKGFPQIVAFLKEDTEVIAVTAPDAQHELFENNFLKKIRDFGLLSPPCRNC